MHFSAGLFGFDLLGMFGSFTLGTNNQQRPTNQSRQRQRQQQLDEELNLVIKNFFLWVAFIFAIWFFVAD